MMYCIADKNNIINHKKMKTTLINKTAVCEGWTHQLLVKPPPLVSLVVTLGVNGK